jgi:hypothetical protein
LGRPQDGAVSQDRAAPLLALKDYGVEHGRETRPFPPYLSKQLRSLVAIGFNAPTEQSSVVYTLDSLLNGRKALAASNPRNATVSQSGRVKAFAD